MLIITTIPLPSTEYEQTKGVFLNGGEPNTITAIKPDGIYTTDDLGITWSPVVAEGLNLDTNCIIIAQSTSDHNFMLVGTTEGIFSSHDAGLTWTASLPGIVTEKIFISPFNDDLAVAVDMRFATTTLYITKDAGMNWTTITSEQLMYIACNGVDFIFTENTVTAYFATNDIGVYSYELDHTILGVQQPHRNSIHFVTYPNPAHDSFTVQVNDENVKIDSIALYSMTGTLILESKAAVINTSGLANGIYLLKVTTANGKTATAKIIKE